MQTIIGSMPTLIRAVLLVALVYCYPATATVYTQSATDQGWYSNAGAHNTTNTNTITGSYFTTEYRSWFKFTIPADCADGVQSAQFSINSSNPAAGGGPIPHVLTLNDVTQANVDDLGVLTSSVALFNDIGNGTVGGFNVAGNGPFSETITLSALTAIEVAAGSGSRAYALGIARQSNADISYIMGYSSAASVTATLKLHCQ